MTCTFDPQLTAILMKLLPTLVSSPGLVLVAWLYWRGTKAWRGKEALNISRRGKVQWGIVIWQGVPSIVYFLAATISMAAWLYTAL